MVKRGGAVLEPLALTQQESSEIAMKVAILDRTLRQALSSLFETGERCSRLSGALRTIAARKDCPIEVCEMIASVLES